MRTTSFSTIAVANTVLEGSAPRLALLAEVCHSPRYFCPPANCYGKWQNGCRMVFGGRHMVRRASLSPSSGSWRKSASGISAHNVNTNCAPRTRSSTTSPSSIRFANHLNLLHTPYGPLWHTRLPVHLRVRLRRSLPLPDHERLPFTTSLLLTQRCACAH